jgi:predicted branched-subunit amino acid permease
VLAALFVVLTIEQYYASRTRFPFMAAIGAGVISLMLFSPENMLLLSIIIGTLILMVHEKITKREHSDLPDAEIYPKEEK